jgi:hypothetical protein
MVGWTGNLKYIAAMTITEDTITGTELLNKYIVTAIQNSRENSRQLLCFDKNINSLCFCARFIGTGTLRNICSWLLLCPVSSTRPCPAKCL